MENLPLLTKENLLAFSQDYLFWGHEQDTFNQILLATDQNAAQQLAWFMQFGSQIRHIISNSYAYRHGLKFGFSKIEFDRYGWFKSPDFLDQEILSFGLTTSYHLSDYSTITLGRGANSIWTYALGVSYGSGGSYAGLSVYGPTFASKEDALQNALKTLRNRLMVHSKDLELNQHGQTVLSKTFQDLDQLHTSKVQLSLF